MWTSLLLALSLGGTPPADHVLNPDFDTGTADWKFVLDAGGGGLLQWDATTGSPVPGSARVANALGGDRRDSWSQCVLLPPGPYILRAVVASQVQAGNHCELRLVAVDHNDCSDGSVVVLDHAAANTHNDGMFEMVAFSAVAPPDAAAAVVYLSHVRVAAADLGASECRFDHVELLGDVIFDNAFES